MAATTNTPVLRNWKKLILTIRTVLNSVRVSLRYFWDVKTRKIWIIAFIIEMEIEDTVLISSWVFESWEALVWATANPYWMAPPTNRSTMENKLYRVFLQIAPFNEILVFSQTISSG